MKHAIAMALIISFSVSAAAQTLTRAGQSVRVRLTAHSGERVTGKARAIQSDVLELERDGDDGRITFVKMDSIRVIERGSRRTARPMAAAIGTGAGIVGAVGSIVGGLLWCNDEHVRGACWTVMQALAFVASPVLGGLLGWHLGRTNWAHVTADDLGRALQPPP
jgi:hypothetical protein